jgi:hypothetical protein
LYEKQDQQLGVFRLAQGAQHGAEDNNLLPKQKAPTGFAGVNNCGSMINKYDHARVLPVDKGSQQCQTTGGQGRWHGHPDTRPRAGWNGNELPILVSDFNLTIF